MCRTSGTRVVDLDLDQTLYGHTSSGNLHDLMLVVTIEIVSVFQELVQ